MSQPSTPALVPDVTMERSSPGWLAFAVVCATAVLVAEGGLLFIAAQAGTLLLAAAGHGVVVGLLAVSARLSARVGSRYLVLLWVSTLVFGIFGPAGVLLTIGLERFYRKSATDIDEWHTMLFPPSHVDESAELWRRIGQRASDVSGEQQITPFLDVLAFGTVPQRQTAIAIIVQQFNPAFAPALKAALRDEHNVIRVQAATAIARLENEFLERTIELQENVRLAPASPDAVLRLAMHYDDQAFAGLLDPTREQECRVQAADGYQRYLELMPNDHKTRFRYARLQQRRGRWPDAERLFRQLLDDGHTDACHWYLETLYAQGRFGDLRAAAAAAAQGDTFNSRDAGAICGHEVVETVALWASREVAA